MKTTKTKVTLEFTLTHRGERMLQSFSILDSIEAGIVAIDIRGVEQIDPGARLNLQLVKDAGRSKASFRSKRKP